MIKIVKCRLTKTDPVNRIVGFSVENDTGTQQIYHEILLENTIIHGKTPEECIDIAFSKLSGSIERSINKLNETNSNIIGSYYVP